MKRTILGPVLCLLAALCVGANAQAGILYFKLTASQQDLYEEEIRPSLIVSTAKKFKITSSEILTMLAAHYTTALPSSAALFLDPDGNLSVIDLEDGSTLLLVEETVLAIGAVGQSILTDTDNNGGYRGSADFLGAVDFSADAEENYFYLSGPSRDRFVVSYRTGRYTYLWSVKAAGDGELDGIFTFITGTLNEKETGILE